MRYSIVETDVFDQLQRWPQRLFLQPKVHFQGFIQFQSKAIWAGFWEAFLLFSSMQKHVGREAGNPLPVYGSRFFLKNLSATVFLLIHNCSSQMLSLIKPKDESKTHFFVQNVISMA